MTPRGVRQRLVVYSLARMGEWGVRWIRMPKHPDSCPAGGLLIQSAYRLETACRRSRSVCPGARSRAHAFFRKKLARTGARRIVAPARALLGVIIIASQRFRRPSAAVIKNRMGLACGSAVPTKLIGPVNILSKSLAVAALKPTLQKKE